MTILAAALASPVAARRACAGLALAGRCGAASSSPTRTRCSTPTRSSRAAAAVRDRRATTAASSAWPPSGLDSTTSARSPGASAGCRRCSRSAAASGWSLRDRRLALVLAPAPSCCSSPRPPVALLRALAAAGLPDPLPARGVGVSLLDWLATRCNWRWVAGARARRCVLRAGRSSTPSTTTSCSPARTRASWPATGWWPTSRPDEVVVEPIAPDQWAADAGRPFETTADRQRQSLEQVADVALVVNNDGTVITSGARPRRQARGLRAHDAPGAGRQLHRGGFCWVVTGSTQFGRAYADPKVVPQAINVLRRLEAGGDSRLRVSPYGKDTSAAVLLRLLVQLLPAGLRPPGSRDPDLPSAAETALREATPRSRPPV